MTGNYSKCLCILFAGLLAAHAACGSIIAQDNADNDPYPLTGYQPGDNGGVGFTGWAELEVGDPGSMYLASSIDGDTYSWGINGTYALGRGFSNTLSAGRVTWLAVHDPDNTGFSGFNLKSSTNLGFATDEVIRFGLSPGAVGYTGEGIYVSTNGGVDYTYLDCGWVDGEGDTIEYTFGWNLQGAYSLSVSNISEGVLSTFTGGMSTGSVSMLGAAVYGSTLSESFVYDSVAVVPEPGTLVLSILALVTLAAIRKRSR